MFQTTTVAEMVRQRAIERAAELNAQSEDTGDFDGWKITAKQCNAINRGEREAVDKFFEENSPRLRKLAKACLRRSGVPIRWDRKYNRYEPSITEIDDCLNQLYIDMRQGFLIFAMVPRLIARVSCHSFHYAGVGGFGDEDGVYIRKELQGARK